MKRKTSQALLPALVIGCIALSAFAGEEEVTVKFSDAPAAVQKTFQEQAPGVTIDVLEKETEKGRTVYEAEVVIDGQKYEIEVAEDGTFLSKELDDDDDEDEDGD